jgi:hypothetical protein
MLTVVTPVLFNFFLFGGLHSSREWGSNQFLTNCTCKQNVSHRYVLSCLLTIFYHSVLLDYLQQAAQRVAHAPHPHYAATSFQQPRACEGRNTSFSHGDAYSHGLLSPMHPSQQRGPRGAREAAHLQPRPAGDSLINLLCKIPQIVVKSINISLILL